MKPIIVTTTFYKSVAELRFGLACKMVDAAVSADYTVIIVDDSPDPQIASLLKASGATVYHQHYKHMGPGRREAFFHGWMTAVEQDAESILWMEAEKIGIIQEIEKIVEPIETGEADIVIPKRSEASCKSWPAFQMESESAGNRRYNEIFGTADFDPFFGPVAFSTVHAAYFILCNAKELGVEDSYINHYGTILAIQDGAKVVSVEVSVMYPPEQRAEEEGALSDDMVKKRRWQYETLVKAYEKLGNVA